MAQSVNPNPIDINSTIQVIGNGKIFEQFSDSDKIMNLKTTVTETNWSYGNSILTAFYTASIHKKENYYFDVYNTNPQLITNSEPQFTISYGDYDGRGAAVLDSSNTDKSLTPTKTIYSQYRNFLLGTETTKFVISGPVDSIFVIDFQRNRFKQQLDVGNWELNLNGTTFIDNSLTDSGSFREGGKSYDIVSGTISSGVNSTDKYGIIYPAHGLMIFDATKLNSENIVYSEPSEDTNELNQQYLLNAFNSGSSFQSRNEQTITSQMYFVRANHIDYNFSNNPTFVHNTVGDLRFDEMINQPSVYITSIGLYNDENDLLAIAKLSNPVLKTFETEPQFRIKIDI